MSDQITYRRAMAAVYTNDDDVAWLVTETPSEVAELVFAAVDADARFVKLTLGNYSAWNGKPLYLRPETVTAISPPKDQDAEEDDDEEREAA